MSVYRVQDKGLTFSSDSARRFIMGAPEHYLFLMDNFKKVNKKVICSAISERFWYRISLQSTLSKKVQDFFKSFQYDFMGSIKRAIYAVYRRTVR